MGSRSIYHGLTGISSRRIKSNVSKRTRKSRLNEAKKPHLAEINETLKATPEIS
jgi:hypothetical protein